MIDITTTMTTMTITIVIDIVMTNSNADADLIADDVISGGKIEEILTPTMLKQLGRLLICFKQSLFYDKKV